MTMSIRRMTLGEGYRYLMSSVARVDGTSTVTSNLTRYYAESGTPPGRFIGAGLAGLNGGHGVQSGSQVSEEHLYRMLGLLQDPISGDALGRLPNRTSTDSSGAARRPVAGFDLTFSVPKSVSAMWAVADPETQKQIYEAHLGALTYTIRYAENHVFSSRSGRGGVLQEDVQGIVGAAFDHWDSRSGDPQLHTHVAVMNRAQTADGTWKTLDSRALFKAAVSLSALYNGVLSDYLTNSLGVGWEPTGRANGARQQYEIVGVPERLREEFSQRSKQIDAVVESLASDAALGRGRPVSERERLRLRQQAVLMTRPDKQHHSLAELTRSWRGRANQVLSQEPEAWVATLRNRNDLPLLLAADLDDASLRDAGSVAAQLVSEHRATFTRSNVIAEVFRQLQGVRFASPDDRVSVAERTTTLALDASLLITPPELTHTPERFQRADGTSRFRGVDSKLYTSRNLLEAEARLLDAGRQTTGPAISAAAVAAVTDQVSDGRVVASSDQAAVVEQIATSGRVVDVLVGAAGSGKSTTMGTLRRTWEAVYGEGSVIGLAPSATAADVLANELGIATENTAKWLTESERQPERLARIDELRTKQNRRTDLVGRLRMQHKIDAVIGEVERWSLHPNQLLIVDEASLVGTFALDTLAEQARDAGAKIVLVGDWAQLSAVTAGGAFHMLVRDRDDAPELNEVRRFNEGWERRASIGLRLGQADVLTSYAEHDCITGGDRDAVLESLFRAWQNDIQAGRVSLMIASDNGTVRQLNDRARAVRVASGEVAANGVVTSSGSTVGVGDRIVTRRNDRSLATGNGWVKNGDEFVVTAVHRDGSCSVRASRGQSSVRLPRGYVAESVDLAYATNAHRAQGRTVDTAHAYVTVTTHRELLYVMATRGRESNRLYVDTVYDPDPSTVHGPIEERAPLDVLAGVLANEGGDRSATETARSEWNEYSSIARLVSEYETIAASARADRYADVLARCGLSAAQVDAVRASESYGPLLSVMHGAEARGLPVDSAFASLVGQRGFGDAEDIASVLHHRVDRWIAARGPRRQRDENRIVGLFPHVVGVTDPEMSRALDERQQLIEQRSHELVTTGVDRRHPWAAQLGSPPSSGPARAAWFGQASIVAAYRERWNVHDRTVLGAPGESVEQIEQRRLAERAAVRALTIHCQELGIGAETSRTVTRQADRVIER